MYQLSYVTDVFLCADTDCPLMEASSQRIPRLTVKVQHRTQTHSLDFSDSSVMRCEEDARLVLKINK